MVLLFGLSDERDAECPGDVPVLGYAVADGAKLEAGISAGHRKGRPVRPPQSATERESADDNEHERQQRRVRCHDEDAQQQANCDDRYRESRGSPRYR